MAEYWNNETKSSLFECVCDFLDNLYDDVDFRPEQFLRDSDCLSVVQQKNLETTVYVDESKDEKLVFEILCKSSGDSSSSRFSICSLLENIVDKCEKSTNVELPHGYVFKCFEKYSPPVLVQRDITGDDVYSVSISLKYKKEADNV